jgi:hypothetical protein
MDSRRRFRPRFVYVMTPQGTLEQRRSGCVDWPSNRVESCQKRSRRDRKPAGQPKGESSGVDSREKLGVAVREASVP